MGSNAVVEERISGIVQGEEKKAPTWRISLSSIHPFTSVLLENTRRLAPASRCSATCQSSVLELGKGRGRHLFLEQPMKLVSAVLNPKAVCRVDDPYQGVGLLKVVAPVRA